MVAKKEETKTRIIQATVEILSKTDNPDHITIREIAERVGIGVGLINYHFSSRDNLLHIAASTQMSEMAESFIKMGEVQNNPEGGLRTMLKSLSDIIMRNQKLNKISAEYELLKGNFQMCLYLLPLLREIFKGKKDEAELRIIAFQIVVFMQVVFLRQDAFYLFSGFNINIKEERDKLVDSLINNYIQKGVAKK